MLLNRREMLASSAVLAAAALVGCTNRTNPVLRVGTSAWPGYEPLFFARNQNYFDDAIQIVEYPGTPEIHRSFQNRAVEAATVTLDEALLIAQLQSDLRVVMAIDFSHGADALLAKPDIVNLADLQGKRIGAEPNSAGALILSRVLERAELKREQVTIIPLSTARAEAAFLNGSVDAVIAYEPVATRLRDHGAHRLFDSSQMPGEIVDVLIVRKETIQTQRQGLTRLLDGWFKGLKVFEQETEDAVDAGAAHAGVTADQFVRIQNRIELLDHSRNLSLFDKSEGALSDTVRKLGATLKKYGMINEMIDPMVLLDSTILESVR